MRLSTYLGRLATFSNASIPGRRASARSKKATSNTLSWPHENPHKEAVAFAGFIFKPSLSSPDNVFCETCQHQLDGWEEGDNPAHEHLVHSPNCGYAIQINIRLREGDPNRTEDDPMSSAMIDARLQTFGDAWPLEDKEGFPKTQQMVEAGWYYDPSPDHSDGVTCAYCCLSLDDWDHGDNPMEEHYRRSQECLFFGLQDMYNKKKGGRQSKKRTSTAKKSTTKQSARSKPSTKTTSTRTTKQPTRVEESPQPRESTESTATTASRTTRQPSKRKQSTASTATRTTKQQAKAKKQTQRAQRASTASTSSRTTRAQKRESQVTDTALLPIDTPPNTMLPKATTPKSLKRKSDNLESEDALPGPHTPEGTAPINKRFKIWEPVDIDKFMEDFVDARGLSPSVDVDTFEYLKTNLTQNEQNMSIEEWVKHNGKNAADQLKRDCEQMVSALDAKAQDAIRFMIELPTID